MRAVIVYDSVHGNTEKVARAIAEGLAETSEVVVRKVAEAETDDLISAELVIAGSPTHAWNMSRASLEFFQRISHGAFDGKLAAAFDTRFRGPLTGSAAGRISRALQKRGFRLMLRPESFFVAHMQGPLREGELERARAFGSRLAAEFVRA
jgi:flavodoxin